LNKGITSLRIVKDNEAERLIIGLSDGQVLAYERIKKVGLN